jgi:hypothetical protein
MHPWPTILTTTTTLAPVSSIGTATNAGRRRELGTVGGSAGEGRRGFEWTCSTCWRWGCRAIPLDPAGAIPLAPAGAITLPPAAPFRSCTATAFLTRAADACSRCRAAAASLSSRRIAAQVGLGMNLGIEIQLYERKKMARIGRFRGHLPAHTPGRGESRLRRGSTTAVVQRCWSRLFCVGAHAPVVLSRRDDASVFGSARGGM